MDKKGSVIANKSTKREHEFVAAAMPRRRRRRRSISAAVIVVVVVLIVVSDGVGDVTPGPVHSSLSLSKNNSR